MHLKLLMVMTVICFVSNVFAEEVKRELASATYPKPGPPAELANPAPATYKFGGFFDFRFSSLLGKDDPNIPNANAESGFGLEDGGFLFNYEKDRVAVVGELAFRRAKDVDINPAATIPNQTSNDNFAFGVDKSQLYMRYKVTPDLTFDFGQFAQIFGVEAGDSKDRAFAKTGLVSDSFLPATGAGFMLEYTSGPTLFKAVAANPNTKGSNGTSAGKDEHTEYGASFGYSSEHVHGQVAYLSRGILRADAAKLESRTLSEALLGFCGEQWSLDFEYDRISDPSKNTLTAADNTDLEDAATGMITLFNYKFNDDWNLGLRYETLADDPNGIGIKAATTFGGNLRYKVSSDVELRAEYIGYDYKNVADVKWNNTRYSFSSIVSF